MDIKDEIVKLYIKKFVIPGALVFDKPGFVDFKISGKTSVFARQFLVPELFFERFEKTLIEKQGSKGAKKLYSIGKKFGYSFAQVGRFENIKDHPGNAVLDWVVTAIKFVEGTYAARITQTIDLSRNRVDCVFTNFAICEKINFDYYIAAGGGAGVIAWILQDPSIEGIVYDGKQEGDKHVCKVTYAPSKVLLETFKPEEVFIENDVSGLEPDTASYRALNAEVDFGAGKSFQSYLNSKIFSYSEGKIMYSNQRFFLAEATALYLLEKYLDTESKKILEDAAFSTGFDIFGTFANGNLLAVSEVLTALGWGKITILGSKTNMKLVLEHYPWTKYYNDVDFCIIRGLLSGAISNITGSKVTFKTTVKDISKGYLNLMFQM
ncbi:MAG: hypothetical protein WC408_00760 [Candidatus Micrarchaeia archaeon]|jgi:hypothetical protein